MNDVPEGPGITVQEPKDLEFHSVDITVDQKQSQKDIEQVIRGGYYAATLC